MSLSFKTEHSGVTVDWDQSADNQPAVIAAAILEALRSHAEENSYYERFYVDRGDDLNTEEMQGIFIRSVHEGVEEHAKFLAENPEGKDEQRSYILQKLEENLNSKGYYDDGAHDSARNQFGSGEDIAESIISALEDLELDTGIKKDDIIKEISGSDELEDVLFMEVVYGCEDSDKSSVENLFKHIGPLEVLYTTINGRNIEDSMVECNTNYGSAVNVIPNESFKSFLTMLNLPPKAYVEAVKNTHSIDLTSSETRHSEDWNKLVKIPLSELGINPKRKPALSAESAMDVIDNTNGYGTPTFAVRISAEDLISMASNPDREMLFTGGGQIGIHDFINGSGNLEKPTGPVVLKTDIQHWSQMDGPEKLGRWDFNDIYGYVKSAFNAEVKFVPSATDKEFNNSNHEPSL